jgi:hypothetical protein
MGGPAKMKQNGINQNMYKLKLPKKNANKTMKEDNHSLLPII